MYERNVVSYKHTKFMQKKLRINRDRQYIERRRNNQGKGKKNA
jgi:hypothetical protein